MTMLQFQPNSNPNFNSAANANAPSNSGYAVSSHPSFSQSPSSSFPVRGFPSMNRGRGPRYNRPASINSLASNFSSFSASSTYVHPSSIYEGQEGHDGSDSQYHYNYHLNGFDDGDTSSPDAYDEDRFDDHSYTENMYDDSDDSTFLYTDTSTIENALPFHVLAVYDFTEGDPENMLFFQKGDLLEIISIQSSGWWAAQALNDLSEGESTSGDRQKQSTQEQERVGWIPSAFVNVVPTHLFQHLKDTPRERRISKYERAELFVESPEDIDSLIQSWGLDFDILDKEEEPDGEREEDEKKDAKEVIERTPPPQPQPQLGSLQAPTHAPVGPRMRPLPTIVAPIGGNSGPPPQLNTSLTNANLNASISQATTATTVAPNAAAFTSPVQPSPITPVPPNVPAPAPFNLGRRGSLEPAAAGVRQRDRDLPPSLPPPDTPLPPLPEVVELETESTVSEGQRQRSPPLPNPYQHQRSASASTIGALTTTHRHDIRTPSPLPTPPTSAQFHGNGTAAGGTQSTSTLGSTTTVSSGTSSVTTLSASSMALRFSNKDKPVPPPPPHLTTEINTSNGRDSGRERSSSTDSTRSVSPPPNSALSASGDDGHLPIPGGVDVASGAPPHGQHFHSSSFSGSTHSRSASSISSLSFLPRSRSISHGQGSGGAHNVISNTLSSLRRRAARYGAGGGSTGNASGASTATTSLETINITSSPRAFHQRRLSDDTANGIDPEEELDDDDSVIAATKKQQGRTSPSFAIAPVQVGDKEKLRKLLGDDALYVLNAGAGTSAGASNTNGVNTHKDKGASGSPSSLTSTSTGKANAGAFARRRRVIKRRSQESDSSIGTNGKRGSASSFPSISIGSPLSTPSSSLPNPISGGPASHLDLGSPPDDISVDTELEEDTDTALEGVSTPGARSLSPLPDDPRPGGVVTSRTVLTPGTPRTPHAAPGTPRSASGFFPGITGVSAGGRSDKVRRLLGDDDAQAFHNAKLALASQPWYLRPDRDMDSGEIKLEHDGSVKYGSVEALVERLTVPFLKSDLEKKFRHVFLLTFHSFTTAERVLELLIDKYEMDSPPGLGVEEFNEWKDKKLRPTQARVLHFFTLWVDHYGLIQDDPRIIPRLQDFLELIHSPPQNAQIARLILQNIANKRWTDINLPALESVAATRRPNKFSKTKTDVLQIDHGELARHLTLYEARLYLKIRPHECFKFAANQKAEGISNLRAFIATSDRIASWVKMSVLKNDPLGKRADVIQFWIRVAERCRGMDNFSSTAAIVAALTSQVIARLQLTWAHVSRTSRIDPLLKIFETTNNFASYRNTLMMVDGPCVPYIGIFLSDMVKLSEGFPDPPKLTVSTSNPSTSTPSTSAPQETRQIKLINFAKYSKMEDVAQMILKFQPKVRDQYKLTEVVHIMQFLESQLNLAATKDENEYWMRSQALQRSEFAHVDIKKGLEQAGF